MIHAKGDFDSCLEIPLKTEFVTSLAKLTKEKTGKDLKIVFDDV